MNWSRAKTILIVVFLIADIFLFSVTYKGSIETTNTNSISQVVMHLEKQGIKIESIIPDKGISCPLLNVKYKYFDENEALNTFFYSAQNIDIKRDDFRTVMNNDGIFLEMKNNGELFYLNKNMTEEEDEVLNEKQALNKMEEFLDKLDINLNELYSSHKTVEDGHVKMKYTQGYKNMFLDNTYMEIKASNKGVTYLKMLWFESIKSGKTKKDVISPVKVLMKLSEVFKDNEKTVTVEEISQGYLFGLNIEQVKEFDVKTVEEGAAIPVWRIKTDMGYIYINAYNGAVENN